MTRAECRRLRICPACLTRNAEPGQRGDKLMHAHCRKLIDLGWSQADIREDRRRSRLLAVIPDTAMAPQARIVREAGITMRTAKVSLDGLVAAGKVVRATVLPFGSGRPGYVYRRVVGL